jgi:hypothetical protein
MCAVRSPWFRRSQVLVSPEQRIGQRYKLQNSSKASLKGKERICISPGKKSGGPAQVAQKNGSLFKGQLTCFKGIIWAVSEGGTRGLRCLIDEVFNCVYEMRPKFMKS